MSRYKRPPITEAVVEIRVHTAIEQSSVEKVVSRLAEYYPLPPQRLVNVNFQIGQKSAKIQQDIQGFRLTSLDGSGVVSVTPQGISTSQLPPYTGWDSLLGQARRNWDVWKRVVGWREIARVGVRYVNRIDIPRPTEAPLTIEDYLNFSPRLPPLDTAPLAAFAINAAGPLGKDDLNLILNSSTVPSALVKTAALLLDLDLSREGSLPQSDSGLWEFIEKIREHKNRVFEACITEQTRALFTS